MCILPILLSLLINTVYSEVTTNTFTYFGPEGRLTQFFLINEYANWYRASQFCSQNNYNLASITTADIQLKITEFITNSGEYDVDQVFWIGGNDDAIESRFYWQNAEPFNYTNWKSMAPNNNGNCVSLQSSTDSFQWLDEDCNKEYLFICEKQVNPINTDHPLYFESLETGKTYYIPADKMNYGIAEIFCEHNGMKLLTDFDAAEGEVLRSYLNDLGIPEEEFWLRPVPGQYFSYFNCEKAKFVDAVKTKTPNSLCVEELLVFCSKSLYTI